MSSVPTRGQLERSLSQRIQALYKDQLGHRTGKISCQLMQEKIAIIIEDSITQPEQLLAQQGRETLAEQVRVDLENAIKPQIKEVIEEIVGVPVVDLLSDATLETGRTGMIVILDSPPNMRESLSDGKVKNQVLAQ